MDVAVGSKKGRKSDSSCSHLSLAIVLWRHLLPRGNSVRYLGLRLRPGASAPVGGTAGTIASAFVPEVPPELLALSVAMTMWNLNLDRLAGAVAAFAPWVTIEAHPTWRSSREAFGLT